MNKGKALASGCSTSEPALRVAMAASGNLGICGNIKLRSQYFRNEKHTKEKSLEGSGATLAESRSEASCGLAERHSEYSSSMSARNHELKH
jgi:hypothetical protein